jgi:hypothetical protein
LLQSGYFYSTFNKTHQPDMQTGRFSVKGENCKDRLVDFIRNGYSNYYRTDITDGTLFFIEDYSAMTNSDLMFCIKLEISSVDKEICEVELICGGGGEGIFSWGFGNENRRINDIYKRVAEFCFHLDYLVSDLTHR